MGVIFAGARTLRALLAKNAKLFYSFDQQLMILEYKTSLRHITTNQG
jgi:hypothetical protein